MRLHCFYFLFISFFYTNFTVGFVGPSCKAMTDSLGNKPDNIFKEFKVQVCDKKCKPVIAHYDKWAKKNAVTPAIEYVMKKIGVPQHAAAIHKLSNDVSNVIKKECASKLGKKHLCQEPQLLTNFGNCMKAQLMPVVMGRIGELMPLAAEPVCKKAKAYLESPDLWEKVIPGYLDKYAAVCRKL